MDPERRGRWQTFLARALQIDPEDGEALAHETWLALGERFDLVPLRYALGVLRNLRLQRARGDGRRKVRERAWASHDRGDAAHDEQLEAREAGEALRASLAELDPDDRALVLERHVFDATSQALAAIRGVPPATVRGRLRAALARLELLLRPFTDPGMPSSPELRTILDAVQAVLASKDLHSQWSGRLVLHLAPMPDATKVERIELVPPAPPKFARRVRRQLESMTLPGYPDAHPFEMHFDFTPD